MSGFIPWMRRSHRHLALSLLVLTVVEILAFLVVSRELWPIVVVVGQMLMVALILAFGQGIER